MELYTQEQIQIWIPHFIVPLFPALCLLYESDSVPIWGLSHESVPIWGLSHESVPIWGLSHESVPIWGLSHLLIPMSVSFPVNIYLVLLPRVCVSVSNKGPRCLYWTVQKASHEERTEYFTKILNRDLQGIKSPVPTDPNWPRQHTSLFIKQDSQLAAFNLHGGFLEIAFNSVFAAFSKWDTRIVRVRGEEEHAI